MKYIVGMWNKSVILTYLGMAFAVLGIYMCFDNKINYAYCCLIIAGVCDLFDGAVARKVKRNDEEKQFGIEQDSLVDVMSFIALPLCIFITTGGSSFYRVPVFIFFAVSGIARLGYFNVVTADENKAIKYYIGLPVTYTALIFPLVYLLHLVTDQNIFSVINMVAVLVVGILQLLKINIIKPKGAAYIFFALLAVALVILYLVVL
ncbi:MAG: CDP-alcohol phosphatidyltransferase family protein [Lachnospiraceae bacterium]|nr:CDP-alcohol phosphatidyltransferase family protein [Lachnospiraceae bacterium]